MDKNDERKTELPDEEEAVKKKKEALPFYERKSSLVICKAASLAAGILMILSPFFSWRAVLVRADARLTERLSMFDLVKRVFDRQYHESNGRLMLVTSMFLLILLVGAAFIHVARRDQFKPGSAINSLFFFDRLLCKFRLITRLAVPLIGIGAAMVLEHSAVYNALYERLRDTYDSWKSMINMYVQLNDTSDGMRCWLLPGWGCWMFYGGILLYLFAGAFRYLINTLNEDD